MEKIAQDTISLWREEGVDLIKQNFEVFHSLVAQARDFERQGEFDMAAIYCQMAAFHGRFKHSGLFVSHELEQILLSIGNKKIPNRPALDKKTLSCRKSKQILHVATNIYSPYSGIPRLLRRWIQQDTESHQSLVLTQQVPYDIPKIFKEAISHSHGKIYSLNESNDSLVAKAKLLRQYAATADIVVLHTWEHDIIPTIAFTNKEQLPPILYVNHGDHCLWLGASISDLVVNLRESGMLLSQERRGIEPERNLLLPTIVEPSKTTLSRTEAKQKLGIEENSVLLISIARKEKYKTIDGISFADAHVPLLKQYEQAILIVVGVEDSGAWSSAIQQTQGRIRVVGQTENTSIYYQAADIFVDSYPMISNTSLLEAGSYALPLVTRYPFSDKCEIIGADMPGLTGNLIRARDLEEYRSVLSRLVEDEQFRLSLGEATRKKVTEKHTGSNWLHTLEKIYLRASTIPKKVNVTANVVKDDISFGEPDVFCPYFYNLEFDTYYLIQIHITIMPLAQRLRHWIKLVKKYGFQNQIGLLFPQWFLLRYYSRLRSMLPF